jgi:hypothetical protein
MKIQAKGDVRRVNEDLVMAELVCDVASWATVPTHFDPVNLDSTL